MKGKHDTRANKVTEFRQGIPGDSEVDINKGKTREEARVVMHERQGQKYGKKMEKTKGGKVSSFPFSGQPSHGFVEIRGFLKESNQEGGETFLFSLTG